MAKKIECSGRSTSYACETLPTDYDLYERVDLGCDRKALRTMVIWTFVMLAAMITHMGFIHPLPNAFDMPGFRIVTALIAMLVGIIVYILLHEGVHGMFIKLFTGTNPTYGFDLKHGMAYTGSTWFFKKQPYIIIALAPMIVWGVVLGLLLADVPENYYWYLYTIQIVNVTGSAGDLYVACRLLRRPKSILIFDSGNAMNFYLNKTACKTF